MKHIIKSGLKADETLWMSKLSEKYSETSITGKIHGFIYFSQSGLSPQPRIKFYGGSKETAHINDSPAIKFGVDKEPELELSDWMNEENCPNGFSPSVLSDVARFVNKFKTLLLLVWFHKLDEADLLAYFTGSLDWTSLVSMIDGPSPEIENCTTMQELDKISKKYHLYR